MLLLLLFLLLVYEVSIQNLRSVLLLFQIRVSPFLCENMAAELILQVLRNFFHAQLIQLELCEGLLLLRFRGVNVDLVNILDDFGVASVVFVLDSDHDIVVGG